MSEVPMGGYGAPAPELEQPEDSTSSARDPRLLIGGGIGLAVLAVAGAYLFLGGGGGSTPAAVPAKIHHVTATPSVTAAVIPVGKPTAAVRTFKGDVGRDPFRALVTSPPAPTTTAAKPTTTTVPTVTPTSPGSVVGTGGVPTGLPTGLPTGSPPTSAPPTPVTTTTPPAQVLVVLKAIAFHGTTPYVVVTYTGVQYALKTG
ncbi:MAG: hypothetical protein QOI76_2631, partial [Frankiales bacterium]|nr:hypothetical protein [Frankiales bacterium]